MEKQDPISLEGEELDSWIAQYIFGEKKPKPLKGAAAKKVLESQLTGLKSSNGEDGAWICYCVYERGDVPEWHPRGFSQERTEAFRIVDRIKSNFDLWRDLDGEWSARFGVSSYVHAKSDIEAICRAAVIYYQDQKR